MRLPIRIVKLIIRSFQRTRLATARVPMARISRSSRKERYCTDEKDRNKYPRCMDHRAAGRYCQELDLLTKKESATEECLLSAMALNLKRMVKAIFSAMLMDKIWAENMFSQPIFCLCQQVPYLIQLDWLSTIFCDAFASTGALSFSRR